jgi:hypothetical protein
MHNLPCTSHNSLTHLAHRRPFTLREIRTRPAFAQDPSLRTQAAQSKGHAQIQSHRPSTLSIGESSDSDRSLARSLCEQMPSSAEKDFLACKSNGENFLALKFSVFLVDGKVAVFAF